MSVQGGDSATSTVTGAAATITPVSPAPVPAPHPAFEIKVTRNWDGRYIATVPGVHKSCWATGYTAQSAVRNAQRSAFNLMSDWMRGDKDMPPEIEAWFHTVGAESIPTNVGGMRHKDHPDSVLVHPDNNLIPQRPWPSGARPALPKAGTPEYDALLKSIKPAVS